MAAGLALTTTSGAAAEGVPVWLIVDEIAVEYATEHGGTAPADGTIKVGRAKAERDEIYLIHAGGTAQAAHAARAPADGADFLGERNGLGDGDKLRFDSLDKVARFTSSFRCTAGARKGNPSFVCRTMQEREQQLRSLAVWQGALASGESASVLLAVAEQDDGAIAANGWQQVASDLAESGGESFDTAAVTAMKTAGKIASEIIDGGDQAIGMVFVRVTQGAYGPTAEWRALNDATLVDTEDQAATFLATGGDARYLVRLRVGVTDTAE